VPGGRWGDVNVEVVGRGTVRLRPAWSADADAIRALAGLTPATGRLLDRELTTDTHCGIVAVGMDGEVVGYAAGLAQLDEAQLLDVVVSPERRGQGIGTQLVSALLAAVAARGAQAVTLEVADDNAPALRLYRRAGFVVEGRRPGYYPDGRDALLLWRRPRRQTRPTGDEES